MHGTIPIERAPVERRRLNGKSNGHAAPMDADDWTSMIAAEWRKSAESIVRTGRLLIEAKRALRRGEWRQVVEKLPFSSRMAQMLMQVASHPVLADANHGSHLPPSWRTLVELARLPEEFILHHIRIGEIHSEMTRADLATLVKRRRYDFRRLGEALNVIGKFAITHPDPSKIVDLIAGEYGCTPRPKLAEWLTKLCAACEAADG